MTILIQKFAHEREKKKTKKTYRYPTYICYRLAAWQFVTRIQFTYKRFETQVEMAGNLGRPTLLTFYQVHFF